MKQLKYCNESLKQFCFENGLELCRDYSGYLVRREIIIKDKLPALWREIATPGLYAPSEIG
jgi:hypothetical protein